MNRKDSWDHDDDSVLAEIVLSHVRSGSTQIKAFEEAAERLTRTESACGFRWNGVVRKEYEEELQEAKNERKENRSKSERGIEDTAQSVFGGSQEDDPLSNLIRSLEIAVNAAKKFRKEFDQLRIENAQLESKLNEKPYSDDLTSLMKLMDRARELGFTTKENSAS